MPGSDMRRNLYVLGIPFDLNKSEFSSLFGRYGTVMHAVILATVDNASRRRGFVVMSTHEEARLAMTSLSRMQLKQVVHFFATKTMTYSALTNRGHILDVSWAVVQRSQGFLDGADRAMMLSSSSSSGFPSEPETLECSIQPAEPFYDQSHSSLKISPLPTAMLLVTNLPSIMFSQTSDLQPLLYPFGPIRDVRMLDGSTMGAHPGCTAAFVEYVSVASAQEARQCLQGQVYSNIPVNAQFVQGYGARPHLFRHNTMPSYAGTPDAGLNPFAAPFVFNSWEAPSVPSYGVPPSNDAHRAHAHMGVVPGSLSDDTLRTSAAFNSYRMHCKPSTQSFSNGGRPLGPLRTQSSYVTSRSPWYQPTFCA
ncbi:hypothetical protein CONPUDRAFT_167595 [Coniophora puteana RWD-64-598 SS2]|uniref:RRM domain-containing protein n=1 Tax=Coniophora puteana (strain RWD-64-598) TaxID=741705 RepID=A0A5M3MHD5_CONPW|nr:uncharacterized protein CONPUDRAFT_167595 [Coniophora puteana RWD-64-598 SS2]EIW78622.1 hypothetical protein CONPUDRAFT_167595 [Coniophora puteana RWD-64-598 SS2]